MPRKTVDPKKAKPQPKKNGRPKIELDWPSVDRLLQIQCTGEEIAAVLDISYDTLDRRSREDNGETFADYSARKRTAGLPALRRRQWTKAMDGDTQMLKFLGTNYLGQTDKRQTDLTSSDGSMSPPDRIEIVAAPFPDDFDDS